MFIIQKCADNISVQDLGRNQAQHLGFSGSGASDEYSFLLANHLLGNDANTPALEVMLGNIELTFTHTGQFVITGADCNASLDGITLENHQVYIAQPQQVLKLSTPKKMLLSYIAFVGGFNCPKWLGSSSQTRNDFNLPLGLEKITLGQLFQANNNIAEKHLKPIAAMKKRVNLFHQSGELGLRFIPSQFWFSLSEKNQQVLLNQRYQISPDSNRMGYRLKGQPLTILAQSNLSKPVNFGAIQLPDDGQPIILMKERQTIGGYNTLGVVIQTDLFRLAQKRPGESVRFLPIDLMQAQAQLQAFKLKFVT